LTTFLIYTAACSLLVPGKKGEGFCPGNAMYFLLVNELIQLKGGGDVQAGQVRFALKNEPAIEKDIITDYRGNKAMLKC